MTLTTQAEGVSQNQRTRSVGIGRAHAKAILLGEHAVVYGAPALAVPVPQLAVTASAGWSSRTPDDAGGASFTLIGAAATPIVAAPSEGLRRLTAEFMAVMGVADSPHLDVIIDGAVPNGRGLGSSAACARAVALALADLFDLDVAEDTVFDLVQASENVAHGRASGVDARAVGATAPLLFQRGEAQDLDIGCDGLLIIADSGEVGRTKDAVGMLREGFQSRPGGLDSFVRGASQLTFEAVQALGSGRLEELGTRLTAYHELLRASRLSTDRVDALVEAALTAGSYGAKITGGGLGGCVIALTQPEQAREVARQLHEAGAVQTWTASLRGLASHAG
ncbi:mevalonate kinase [Streptacidiphilus sp. MAP12-20]|uniref:mevalonate kinase n=1 Tax=Streptacidiphilus sp. MAP12-20 TaxID=3156299 RepID=UPI003517841A